MYDSFYDSGTQELLQARLAQAEAVLRATQVSTREDLLATVYSGLNAVLALGNNVSPLLSWLRIWKFALISPATAVPAPSRSMACRK